MSWTTVRAGWFPAVAVAALLISCSPEPDATSDLPPGVVEGSPSVAVGTNAPSPSVIATAPECPNESAIAADPARQIGPSSRADVDGDGIEDAVRLSADPSGPDGCATFLVVELANVSVVSAPAWEIGSEGGLPQPRIHGFVDIDGNPGKEILIDEAAGASTQFVGAFVYVDGDLERVTVRGGIGSDVGSSDLFPYGGSVGHVEAVDCTDEGIVVSSAAPGLDQADAARGIYEVERRFYSFDGSVLEKRRTETEDVPIDELNRFPEYSAAPFGSC